MNVEVKSPNIKIARTLITEQSGMALVPSAIFDVPKTTNRCTVFKGVCNEEEEEEEQET